MKTINYFLYVCFCLCFLACANNLEPEPPEEPCPDFEHNNSPFVYGDIPDLAARLSYMGMDRPADSYNYQLYPGMDEWHDLLLSGGLFETYQVTPECFLRKMSTQALIQAIWEFPVLEDFYVILEPYYQRFIDRFIERYNAFQELTKRKDGGQALLKRLTLVNPLTYFLRYESQTLELVLSRSVFLSQLNESEKRKIVEITLSNDEKRYSAWWADNEYRQNARLTAWILIGKTMVAADYGPFIEAMNKDEELKGFVEGWWRSPYGNIQDYLYMEVVQGTIPQLIINYAKNFIKN